MNKFIPVYTAYGMLHAETIKQFLLSFEIEAKISQESVGSTLGLTVGPLGKVLVYVREDQAQQAQEILDKMEEGIFEQIDGEQNNEENIEN